MALATRSVFVSGVTFKAVPLPTATATPSAGLATTAQQAAASAGKEEDSYEVFSEPEPEDETGLNLDDPEVYEELFGYKRKAMKPPAGGASGKAAKAAPTQAAAGAATAGGMDAAGATRAGAKGNAGKAGSKAGTKTATGAADAAPGNAEAPAVAPLSGRKTGRRKDGSGAAGAAQATAAATVQDDAGGRRSNWVQCSDCCQWRVVPDLFWASIQTTDDQEWFCKDAKWNVTQYEPYTPPCGQL